MLRKISFLTILLATVSIISACGDESAKEDDEEYPYGHYEDDKMIGTVSEVNPNELTLIVDISEWEKRDRKGPGMTDEGYLYTAKISDQTVIKYEEANETSIEDIKTGQKVLVNPPRDANFEGQPDEIILLDMTYEEKYSRLLPHTDGMNIVIMYREDEPVPSEMQETMYESAMNILEGTEHRATAGWVPYDENYVVDYKEELDIEQFPVILVFEGKELIFKGYSDDELYGFFRNLIE